MRTSARGAGTRQAPCRHASHISSQEASNATDSPASTRSPGPIGSSTRNRRASASTNAAAAPVAHRDALRGARRAGGEDDPRIVAGTGRARQAERRAAWSGPAVAEDCAHPGLAEDELGPLLGSSASTGTYAAPAERTARIATDQLGGAGRDRTPTRSPTPMPLSARRRRTTSTSSEACGSSAPCRRHRSRPRRVLRHRLGEHVEQRATDGRRCDGIDGGGADEREGHRTPAGVGAVRAQRRQRAARGCMSHLPGERAVSSAGSGLGAGAGHHPGHSEISGPTLTADVRPVSGACGSSP